MQRKQWQNFVYLVFEAVYLGEKIKPIQEAIRRVASRRSSISLDLDRKASGIVYNVFRNLGLLDRIIERITGVNVSSSHPIARCVLRTVAYIYHVDTRAKGSLRKTFKRYAIKYLASRLGRDADKYIEAVKAITASKYTPLSTDEKIMMEYRVSPELYYTITSALLELKEDPWEFLTYTLKPHPHVFRVNKLKASRKAIIRYLSQQGYSVSEGKYSRQAIQISGSLGRDVIRFIETGILVPQDESSMVAVELLDPRGGMEIADLCAAPGGKTTYIAELTGLKATIHSFEIYRDRVRRLRRLLERTGTLEAVRIYIDDARRAPEILGKESMDRVLVDPPCTTTGALARNPDARWRFRRKDLEELIRLQYEILEAGWSILRRGGLLLYTTCSVLPHEGEYIVEKLLRNHSNASLIALTTPFKPSPLLHGTMRAWPHLHGTIGFFYALVKKES